MALNFWGNGMRKLLTETFVLSSGTECGGKLSSPSNK
jgi:hypothetical protein